jgi:hypothetical protein
MQPCKKKEQVNLRSCTAFCPKPRTLLPVLDKTPLSFSKQMQKPRDDISVNLGPAILSFLKIKVLLLLCFVPSQNGTTDEWCGDYHLS